MDKMVLLEGIYKIRPVEAEIHFVVELQKKAFGKGSPNRRER